MGGKSRAGTPTEQTVPHIPRMVMGVATQYFFHDSAIVFCPAHLAEFLCHSYMMTTKGRLSNRLSEYSTAGNSGRAVSEFCYLWAEKEEANQTC